MQWNPNIVERVQKNPDFDSNRESLRVASVVTKDMRVDQGKDKNDIVCVITTDEIDLQGEVIVQDPSAFDMTYLLRNRKVFADHNYDLSSVVGWLRDDPAAWPSPKSQRGWKCRIGMIPTNRLAIDAMEIIKHTGNIGFSIGFIPKDRGAPTDEERERYAMGGKEISAVIRSVDLFEFSLTGLPCNVGCQGTFLHPQAEKMASDIEGLVSRGVIARESAAALGVNIITPKRSIFPTGLEAKHAIYPVG